MATTNSKNRDKVATLVVAQGPVDTLEQLACSLRSFLTAAPLDAKTRAAYADLQDDLFAALNKAKKAMQ